MMQDIRLYDFEFNLLHIEHKIKSANWDIRYNDIGSCEWVFDIDSEIAEVIQRNRYIVLVQGDKQAIITSDILSNAEGLHVFGRTVNWLLTRRTVESFDVINGNVAQIAEIVFSKAFGDVPEMIFRVSNDTSDWKIIDFQRDSDSVASDVIIECLKSDNAGHRLIFDVKNKHWVFEVYKGNPLDFIVSEADKNAYEMKVERSMLDYYTAGYYRREFTDMGEWNAALNEPFLANKNADNYLKYYRVSVAGEWYFGLTCGEGDYLYCNTADGTWKVGKELPEAPYTQIIRESDKTGIYCWNCLLADTTPSDAMSSLKKKTMSDIMSAKLKNLKYNEDYKLGDIVRIDFVIGKTAKSYTKRITGISIWYENNNCGEMPVFEEEEQ